jgi:hypothetical protein
MRKRRLSYYIRDSEQFITHAFVAHSTLGVDRNVLESPSSDNSKSPEAGTYLPQNLLLGGYLTMQTNLEGLF